MNRNSQAHFATTPTVSIGRSKFDRSFTHKTAFNAGDLIPFYVDTTITPGDTVKMNTSQVVRMATPITPVMDNANLDTYFFFVPYRLIWKHFKAFFGENDTAPWIQQTEYEIPQIVAPDDGWAEGTLADYFGIPTKVGKIKTSALPFRAYALIYNEWFRSEVLKNPVYISDGDGDTQGKNKGNNYDPVTDTECGAAPLKAAKYFDYFTGCLPNPQRGPAVNLPLGDKAPVIWGNDHYTGSSPWPETTGLDGTYAVASQISNTTYWAGRDPENTSGQAISLAGNTSQGLYTDLSAAVGATVNALRQAFAVQRFYEKQALYGTRYIEFVKGHFQVTNPDFRMQRPEYLGGMQVPININQVVQTDATSQQLTATYTDPDDPTTLKWAMSDLTAQGNTAAYSLTSGRHKDLFTHSFTEHGILMGFCVVRTTHTYQQGINKQFLMKKFTDFYFPEFANLGNMPVTNNEIYAQGPDTVNPDTGKAYDDEVFGYQEAWAHYRYFPDIVTSIMRSNYDQSLDIWHWADDYESLPSLGDEWIDETEKNIERTLAVQDEKQFWGDFYFQAIYTRPMPLYSVPGLIDHH